MKLSLSNIMRLSQPFAVALAALLVVPSAHAASGTWITTSGTALWSGAGNWSGGTIADGAGFTADFTTGITANTTTVTLDTSRSIGHIIKDDTAGGINDFVIGVSGGSILTMATGGGGAPTITNSDAGVGGRLTIAAQLTGSEGLTKLGVGYVYLTNNNSNWSGTTTISEGVLHMGGNNLNNIGGGSGRNISVAAGAAVGFNTLSNAILNRIVETSGEFTVMTGSTNNNLDFTSATGANLSGAFLGHASTNGGKAEYGGTITMADNYRFGAPGGLQNGAFGILQTSNLSGSNGLIIGGNRVVIVGTHTFTGDTVIRDGARLGLAGFNADAVGVRNNSSALQNSVVDLGTSASTGVIFLEAATTAGPMTNSTTSANGGTTSATFGGLKGSRNLHSAFLFTAPGNNTSATTAVNITGFTLNVGTGVDVGYSGNIGGFGAGASGATGGAMTLTKTGDGTQALSGTGSYTGATNVNDGTLIINGNFSTSILTTVASGATIGGSGSVGDLTVQSGGTIAPGNSPGIFNTGDYVQAGVYEAEIQGLVAGNNPGNHDQINVTGTVDITGGSLVTLFSSTGYSPNDMIFILLNDGADAITGTFTGLAQGAYVTSYDGLDWVITYEADSVGGTFLGGNDIALVALVPEPSTALLGALGALALLRRRR